MFQAKIENYKTNSNDCFRMHHPTLRTRINVFASQFRQLEQFSSENIFNLLSFPLKSFNFIQ